MFISSFAAFPFIVVAASSCACLHVCSVQRGLALDGHALLSSPAEREAVPFDDRAWSLSHSPALCPRRVEGETPSTSSPPRSALGSVMAPGWAPRWTKTSFPRRRAANRSDVWTLQHEAVSARRILGTFPTGRSVFAALPVSKTSTLPTIRTALRELTISTSPRCLHCVALALSGRARQMNGSKPSKKRRSKCPSTASTSPAT